MCQVYFNESAVFVTADIQHAWVSDGQGTFGMEWVGVYLGNKNWTMKRTPQSGPPSGASA